MANLPIGQCELESSRLFVRRFQERRQELLDFGAKGGAIFCYNCLLPKAVVAAAGGQVVKLVAIMNLYGRKGSIIDEYIPSASEEFCTLMTHSFATGVREPYPENMHLLDTATCAALTKLLSMMTVAMPEFEDCYVLNLPRRQERPEDQAFWLNEIYRMKAHVEKITGCEITAESLRREIRKENRKKELIKAISLSRQGPVVPIRGSEFTMINWSQNWLSLDDYLPLLERVLAEVEERKAQGISVCQPDAPRVMVSDPCFFEPFRGAIEPMQCLRLIEDCGATIVAEDYCVGVGEYWYPIQEEGDPFANLAHYILNIKVPCPFMTPNTRRIKRALSAAQELQVDGLVYQSVRSCKTSDAEAMKFTSAFEEHGMAAIFLSRLGAPEQEPVEQMRTRLESFVEQMKANRAVAGLTPRAEQANERYGSHPIPVLVAH